MMTHYQPSHQVRLHDPLPAFWQASSPLQPWNPYTEGPSKQRRIGSEWVRTPKMFMYNVWAIPQHQLGQHGVQNSSQTTTCPCDLEGQETRQERFHTFIIPNVCLHKLYDTFHPTQSTKVKLFVYSKIFLNYNTTINIYMETATCHPNVPRKYLWRNI